MDYSYHEEVKKLIRKAEMTRNGHFLIAGEFKKKSNLLHAMVLIGSSLVAILTFANYKTFAPIFPSITNEGLTLFVGILASAVFILTVVEEFTNWRDKSRLHESAGKQYTTFIRSSDGLLKKGMVSEQEFKSVQEKYNSTNETTPSIDDAYFLKAKQELLRKIAISRELDDNPFLNIPKYIKAKENGSEKK